MYLRAVKMAIGALLATLLAEFIGLNSATTAGVIVLLSLGKTKRMSLESALIRVKAVTLALILGSGVFTFVGFGIVPFGLFLAIFVPIALKWDLEGGLIVGTVLITHLKNAGVIDVDILYNTGMLFVLGVTTALILNLYMPSMKKYITEDQRFIEEKFRVILLGFSNKLASHDEKHDDFYQQLLTETKARIASGIEKAKMAQENNWHDEPLYELKYLLMRRTQFDVLKRMSYLMTELSMTDLPAAVLISELIGKAALELEEFNTGDALLAEAEKISSICRDGALPKSREEFENRAVLFQYLSEFRYFLELKKQFSDDLQLMD